MIGHSWYPGMNEPSTQIFRCDYFTSSSFDQRRSSQEDSTVTLDDNVFISHGRNVGSSCGATTKHDWDLGDSSAWHLCHVVENSTEVAFCREDITLSGQVGSSWVDKVKTRQIILCCYLLCPQMFSDSNWVVCSSLDWRVVGHYHAKPALNESDSSYYTSWVDFFLAVEFVSCEGREFQERWSRIKQFLYSFPDD